MKKTILLLLITFLFPFSSFAKGVDSASAKNIAANFYSQNSIGKGPVSSQSLNLSLAYQCVGTATSSQGENLYYIFNVNDGDGFVIISGDDAVTPILGYSTEGKFDINKSSPAFKSWIDGYKQQILYVINNNIPATDEIKANWSDLVSNNNTHQAKKAGSAVSPLLTTTWDQGNNDASVNGFYNNLCPIDQSLPNSGNRTKHCPTGCVATAMAQIMKFWNYPTNGSGINSYSTSNYGTLSANFGATTYNWGSMPNNVTSPNAAVATLMYQCGVSVDMGYGPDDSGAWVISADNTSCAQNSYVQYFGYKGTTIQGLRRSDYTDAAWQNLLENELNNGRPIQYVGEGSGGGHTFVFDGYDANNYFHVNWGWGGEDDAYYEIDALNPSTLGAGGGSGGFNSNQEAVIGIEPVAGTNTSSDSIVMNSDMYVTPDPINFDQSFTVNFDVYNSGATDFNGAYCAALFDDNGNFISFVDSVYTSSPLLPGYHYTGGINLSNTLLTVPGTYILAAYYKPTGGNWTLIGNSISNSYANPVYITIDGPSNPLELYSDIVATPDTLVQGRASSVNVNFLNDNSSTFYGQYDAVLYDLEGNFVENIGTYSETGGLPSGYDYISPYVTLSSSTVTANPGNYILAILEDETGSPSPYLAGSDSYLNPVNITVVAPPIPPDRYEPDNTPSTAHNFSLTWSNNTASIQTTGSNMNCDTDVDYYSINLAAGYQYTVTANVNDSHNSAYTCNVLWSYDTGGGWSPPYQDVMPGNIVVNGARTVTFYVAPYFQGLTGTYLLNMNVTRVGPPTGINPVASPNDGVNIYPVPNRGQMNVILNGNGYNSLKIYDVLGREVYSQPLNEGQTDRNLYINMGDNKSGVYFIQITGIQGTICKKIVVE